MKKTLLLLVALITATIAFAQTEIDGIYYNLNNSTQTAEVTYQYYWDVNNYSGITTITIPEKVTYNSTEYSVTSIGNYAFYNCSSLTSITIPNSVTSIGDLAFYVCSSLTSIEVNANNPNYASIEGVLYNKDVTTLICCPGGKTSITIPNSVTSIASFAFYGCSSLTSIEVDANNPNYASIEGVLYNKDVTTLICCPGSKTSITIPNSVTSIASLAFHWCSSLTSITIPNGVTSIGDYAFFDCSSLTSITIPNSVTYIGNGAFSYCSSLTSITIPNSVTSIGSYAFDNCYPKTINIQADNLKNYCKSNLNQLISTNNNISSTSAVRHLFIDGVEITELNIPEDVTSISSYSFYNFNAITSISIPNSVSSIGGLAFSGCSSLTSITIPNSVTSIGEGAFAYCSSLTSITIPNGVTSIGEGAFSACSSLTSITIPNGVTSIGDYAFFYCDNLTSITCLGSTPPKASDLGANTSTCTLIVPKEAYSSYLRHEYWGQFLTIRTIGDKEIKTEVNNSAWGAVEGDGYYDNGDEATLTATANDGYRFVKWSDEVTDNPRTIVVTQDSTFTAIFEANSFAITTAVNDDAMGSVTEGGEYTYGTEITLTATPNDGYRFAQWSDGNTDNPRIITVTENKTYTAEFEVAEATNVETSKISSANIYTTNGTLHIEGATDDYHILDAAGRLIYSGNATTLTLPRGIYLVTINGEVEKIAL